MSIPREVIPGRFYMVTRRCTQRTFLLRPDEETNNAFAYCLGEAAGRYDIEVILSQQMSNHHHTIVFDRHGHVIEFVEHFHKMLAKSQNALRGRWENMWSTEPPSILHLIDRSDVIDKLVYAAINPVKDGLVERVHHWPGVGMVRALLTDTPLRSRRPLHFFRREGSMPESLVLHLTIPRELGDRDEVVRELRERIAVAEDDLARLRSETGSRVLGRRAVLRQHWGANPSSKEPRRGLRPRVAGGNQWMRMETLRRNQAFVAAYRAAREIWLAGLGAVFPPGTYWLRRFAGVAVGDHT